MYSETCYFAFMMHMSTTYFREMESLSRTELSGLQYKATQWQISWALHVAVNVTRVVVAQLYTQGTQAIPHSYELHNGGCLSLTFETGHHVFVCRNLFAFYAQSAMTVIPVRKPDNMIVFICGNLCFHAKSTMMVIPGPVCVRVGMYRDHVGTMQSVCTETM